MDTGRGRELWSFLPLMNCIEELDNMWENWRYFWHVIQKFDLKETRTHGGL